MNINEEKLNYNWEKYLALGYTKGFLKEEETKWSHGILELITDKDLVDNCCANVRLLLEHFSYETSFLFLIYYASSFIRDPDVFLERLEQISQKLGSNWDQILVEKLYNNESSIFEAIGYLSDQDWLDAIEKFTQSSEKIAGSAG